MLAGPFVVVQGRLQFGLAGIVEKFTQSNIIDALAEVVITNKVPSVFAR